MTHHALAFVALLLVLRVDGNQPSPPQTYEAFMALRSDERQQIFSTLTPDQKSSLKREHARRWLSKNAGTLSSEQVSLVREAIEFLSPAYYSDPTAPDTRRQEEVLRQRLECSLGRNGVSEALTFDDALSGQSWMEWMDEWATWLKRCPARK